MLVYQFEAWLGSGYFALKCLTGFVSLNMITVFEILAFGFMDLIRFWVIWLCYRLCCWRLVFFWVFRPMFLAWDQVWDFDSLRLLVCWAFFRLVNCVCLYWPHSFYIDSLSVISIQNGGKPTILNILTYCSYGFLVEVLFSSNFYVTCDRQGSRAVYPNNLGDFFPLISLNDNRK